MPLPIDLSEIKRVIFIASDRIGDNLLLTPLFRMLKSSKRNIESILLMDPRFVCLFENVTDPIIPIRLEPGAVRKWIRDNKGASDLYAMPIYRDIPFFHAVFEEIKAPPKCLIFSGPNMDGTNNSKIDYSVANPDQGQSVYAGITRGLLLIKPLLLNAGIDLTELQSPESLEALRPIVNPQLFSAARVNAVRDKYRIPSDKYPVFVNMIATRASRIYNPEAVSEMLERASNYYKDRLLLINQGRDCCIEETNPSITEWEYALNVTNSLRNRENISLLDPMPLEDLVSVLYCCSEVITNDTSISHITADLHFKDTRVTVLYTNETKQNTWFFPGINRYSRYLDVKSTGRELFEAIRG